MKRYGPHAALVATPLAGGVADTHTMPQMLRADGGGAGEHLAGCTGVVGSGENPTFDAERERLPRPADGGPRTQSPGRPSHAAQEKAPPKALGVHAPGHPQDGEAALKVIRGQTPPGEVIDLSGVGPAADEPQQVLELARLQGAAPVAHLRIPAHLSPDHIAETEPAWETSVKRLVLERFVGSVHRPQSVEQRQRDTWSDLAVVSGRGTHTGGKPSGGIPGGQDGRSPTGPRRPRRRVR